MNQPPGSKEDMMPSSGDKLTYFLVGGFIGACVALLFAPKSGEETRNYLEGKYREGSDKLTQKTHESKEALKQKADWVADKARQSGEKLKDRSRGVVEQVSGSLDKGKESLARQKDQLAKAVEAGKAAYQEEKERLGTDEKAES